MDFIYAALFKLKHTTLSKWKLKYRKKQVFLLDHIKAKYGKDKTFYW